jgi:transmembrane sensor
MGKWTTMESRSAQLNRIASPRVRAQAALWVTELHGPDRDAKLEARVRRWIDEDPTHAAAFELATEAWQRSGNLPAELPARVVSKHKPAPARVPRPVLACVALMIAGLMAAIYFAREGTLTTGPGEQKTIELSDGTQVSLNANSRLLVQYDDRVRKVTLTGGEVLFNVTKHQSRPFVVVIGDQKVIAVGTSFMVRREDATGSASSATAFAVTLVEGRIAVEPLSWPDALPSDRAPQAKVLNPGERLRFRDDAPATLDTPPIDSITAWQRGQLIFDDTSLSEAAAEFNRYGSRKIHIDSAIGNLRVGGVFRIGDPSSFAYAMANMYHLSIVNRGNEIVLTAAHAE